MTLYPMFDTKAKKAAFGVFLFAMLLLARDTLITSSILGFTKSQFLMLGLICACGMLFLARNRRAWKDLLLDRRMAAAALCAFVLLIPMIAKGDWQMMYFSILICLLLPIFLSYFTTYEEIAKYYVVMLSLLGVYSVFATYFLKDLAYFGRIPVSTFENSSGWTFYNFGLAYVVTWEFWNRNFGIFREPGVYQFFVLLALYLNNYAVSWDRSWKLWLANAVLAVTMVSTFAIGGFIEMGLLAVFLYFDKKYYKTKWGKRAGIAVVVLVPLGAAFIAFRLLFQYSGMTIYYEFYDMFRRLTTDSDSLVDRLSAITANLGFFLRRPVFGDTIANVLHGTNHNTSSTLILYAVLGVVGGSLNVAAWIALAWKRERCLLGNGMLLLILFMSFNTQNLVADVFFWLFPMMALLQRGLPLLPLRDRKV